MVPPADDGQGNLKNTARSCLYAIAPVYFWQYFSSQGRSSTTKFSLLEDMPHCFEAIITVCAQLSRLPQQTIVTAVANVMKSCRHRAASKNYRRLHPELVWLMRPYWKKVKPPAGFCWPWGCWYFSPVRRLTFPPIRVPSLIFDGLRVFFYNYIVINS